LFTRIVIPVTSVIPRLVSSGRSRLRLLWLAIGAAAVANLADSTPRGGRSEAAPHRPSLALFLPVMAGLWIWRPTALVARIVLVAVGRLEPAGSSARREQATAAAATES
jgi:hypothetical protein